MKLTKSAIALALLSSFSLTATAADVVFYGKVNVSFQYSDDKEEGNGFTEIRSNASRVGFKGDHKLNDDLKVVYKAEFQVDIDGDDDNLTERTQYIGLVGNFGETYVGKGDTMVKQSQGKIDLFNDLEADIKYLWSGENRAGSSVAYFTPKFGDFQFGATYIAEEGVDADHGLSLAAFYGDKNLKKSKIFASISHDMDVEGESRAFDSTRAIYDTTRASVQGKVAGLKLGAIYHMEENKETGAELDGFLFSASYGINDWTLKGQYQTADMDGGQEKAGYSLGADYKLAKPTKVYAFYTMFDNDLDEDHEYLGVGIEHKF